MASGLRAAALCAVVVLMLAVTQTAGANRYFPSWWYRQAMCVHRGEGAWNANTGNGFYGGMQFMHGTWVSNGGRRFAEYPHRATPVQQLIVAYWLWRRAGWRPWPNTARACGLL